MNFRNLFIPLLCLGAVAFACGPRSHSEAVARVRQRREAGRRTRREEDAEEGAASARRSRPSPSASSTSRSASRSTSRIRQRRTSSSPSPTDRRTTSSCSTVSAAKCIAGAKGRMFTQSRAESHDRRRRDDAYLRDRHARSAAGELRRRRDAAQHQLPRAGARRPSRCADRVTAPSRRRLCGAKGLPRRSGLPSGVRVSDSDTLES